MKDDLEEKLDQGLAAGHTYLLSLPMMDAKEKLAKMRKDIYYIVSEQNYKLFFLINHKMSRYVIKADITRFDDF